MYCSYSWSNLSWKVRSARPHGGANGNRRRTDRLRQRWRVHDRSAATPFTPGIRMLNTVTSVRPQARHVSSGSSGASSSAGCSPSRTFGNAHWNTTAAPGPGGPPQVMHARLLDASSLLSRDCYDIPPPLVGYETFIIDSSRSIRSASSASAMLPTSRLRSSRAAPVSPPFAASTRARATSATSSSVTASSNATRRAATRFVYGLPGPPGLPGANRPPGALPFAVPPPIAFVSIRRPPED